MLYTLNIYSAVCQLYLDKTGKKLWGAWLGDNPKSEPIQEGYLEEEEFQVALKGGLALE